MKQGQIEQVAEIVKGLDMIAGGCPHLLFRASLLEKRLLADMEVHKNDEPADIAFRLNMYQLQYDSLYEVAQEYWSGFSYENI